MTSSIPGFSGSGGLWSSLGICLPSKLSRCSIGSGGDGEHRGDGVPTQLPASWLSRKLVGVSVPPLWSPYCVPVMLQLDRVTREAVTDFACPELRCRWAWCPEALSPWMALWRGLGSTEPALSFALDRICPRSGCRTVLYNTVATSAYSCFSLNQ